MPPGMKPASSSGFSFSRMMGINPGAGTTNNLNSLAGNFRHATRNFAAGFARDPAVRQMQSQILMQEDAQKKEQKAAQIQAIVKTFDTFAEVGRSSGGKWTPALEKMAQNSVSLLTQLGEDPQVAQSYYDQARAIAEMPVAPGEADYQNVLGPNGENLGIINVNDPAAIGQLPQGARLTGAAEAPEQVLPPDVEQQKIRIAHASRPPAATTTVNLKNYGDIPPGYRLVEGPQGVAMELVPGSPQAKAEENKARQTEAVADVVTGKIEEARQNIKDAFLPTTGFIGQQLQDVGGTAAHNLQQTLATIQTNIGFQELQKMRDNSPTGGALGQVTVPEIEMLQSTLASVKQSQTEEQLRQNLDQLEEIYLDVIHGPGNRPKKEKKAETKTGTKADDDISDLLTKDPATWTDEDIRRAEKKLGK